MRRFVVIAVATYVAICLAALWAGAAFAHQSNDHSPIGVDVTIESAVLIGGGHIRVTGKYICGPEDEQQFGRWGVGYRVWDGAEGSSGRAERSGPLTHASCTGKWETWTLDSLAVYDGGITTTGSKIAYPKIQDALQPSDTRTHKHLGGHTMIPVTGGAVSKRKSEPTEREKRPCLERDSQGRCVKR